MESAFVNAVVPPARRCTSRVRRTVRAVLKTDSPAQTWVPSDGESLMSLNALGSLSWKLCDVDPSCVDDLDVRKEARVLHQSRTLNRDVTDAVGIDPSAAEEVTTKESWRYLDVDLSCAEHVPTSSGSPISPPACSRPTTRNSTSSWRSWLVDLDPTHEFEHTLSSEAWMQSDVDPSSGGFVAWEGERPAVPRSGVLRATLSMAEAAVQSSVDVDTSNFEAWPMAHKAKSVESAFDWDETHLEERVSVPRRDVSVPSSILWLMDASDRVILECMAGGRFVLIARSSKAHVSAAFICQGESESSLAAVRNDLPRYMGLYELPADLHAFLRQLAQNQLESMAAKWDGGGLVMAGADI